MIRLFVFFVVVKIFVGARAAEPWMGLVVAPGGLTASFGSGNTADSSDGETRR